jgi:hypothetical protein
MSLLKLRLGAQSDNISCKDGVISYRAKGIYCKSGVLNAKVLCEDKRVTDILIFSWRSFRNCEDENFEETGPVSDSLKSAVRQAISITDKNVKRVESTS